MSTQSSDSARFSAEENDDDYDDDISRAGVATRGDDLGTAFEFDLPPTLPAELRRTSAVVLPIAAGTPLKAHPYTVDPEYARFVDELEWGIL